MPHRRTTFSKFIIESLRRRPDRDAELAALLNDVMTACKMIAAAAARGPAARASEPPCGLDAVAGDILRGVCEFGGQACGMLAADQDAPYAIPDAYPLGRYLLVFAPLDGASNIDVNMPVGTIFSVLRAPDGVTRPTAADFLQPGTSQVAAGYALHGPLSMLVATLGDGVFGFTLDREIGAYVLTHPRMQIAEATCEVAVNASNARFWEPPVRRYVEECVDGQAGARGDAFSMRWIASMVAELHRVLIRGGLFLSPRDTREAGTSHSLRLLHEANPMAMIVEQAGGAASTGRRRLMDLVPNAIDQRVPAILGSRQEVARLERYHAAYDAGEPLAFVSPLFNPRSLFRTA